MNNTPVIELQKVSKVYSSGGIPLTALHPADLVVGNGEFICIAGPSGSGKTTLLNLIGLIDFPTSGTVLLEGMPTSGLNRTESARVRLASIGFVFQSHNLIPVLSAYENVDYVLSLKGVGARERRERVLHSLSCVGLEQKAGKHPGELSGGEQQRVAVARAIVGSPPIVLADEPTASLDSATGEALITLFRSLSETEAMTFIFSSHDPRIIASASRVLALRDGTLQT